MRKALPYLPLLVLLGQGCSNDQASMDNTATAVPPQAQKRTHTIKAHGQERLDEYYWLQLTEDQRNEAVPDDHTKQVVAHLDAENAYCEAMLEPVKQLREELYTEIKARIKEEDVSIPYRENGYWYHHRFEEGKEYPVHVRKQDVAGAQEVDIFNENLMAEGSSYYDLADYDIAPGNEYAGYSEDKVGRRQYELRFQIGRAHV